jgi:hypothetical protein
VASPPWSDEDEPAAETVELPPHLLARVERIPEFRMGVKRVAVVLVDGQVLKPAC